MKLETEFLQERKQVRTEKKKRGRNSVLCNRIVKKNMPILVPLKGFIVDNKVVPEVSTHKNLMNTKTKEASEAILVVKNKKEEEDEVELWFDTRLIKTTHIKFQKCLHI